MRRVFNHHVCFCVLSTAILAGLALMTSQTKVYAGKNCKGVAGGEDSESGLIVCDGTRPDGSGWSVDGGWGELSGTNRNIDMSVHSRDEAAVTVYNKSGRETKIRIKSKLTVTNKSGKNNNPAIKVEKGGKLALVGGVNVTEVKKGIVVDGPRSSVMVLQGTIGVLTGGGPVIELSNNGKVVLNDGVTVGPISGNVNGEVVINNGGTLRMDGQSFTGVTTGIVVKGATGTANVRGGATITVKQGGTGMDVEGNANVMDMTIKGSGGNGMGVLINGSGTVVMTKVKLMQLETGARVTNGTLTLNGGSKIEVGGSGTGFNVSGGKVVMMGGSLTVKGNGKGMEVEGGNVEMMGGSITGNGNTGTGVEVKGGTANVTLTSVNISKFATGINMTGGTLMVEGKTTIKVGGSGSGVSVSGSGQVMMNGTTTINVTGSGKGMYVKGGTVVMEGTTKIEVTENGTGMYVSGGTVMMMEGGSLTITGKGSGSKGVYVGGGANVTLERVNISKFATGVYMTGGTLMVREGMIVGNGSGTGIYAKSGKVTLTSVDISNVGTGVEVDGGTLTVEGGEIGFAGSGKGVYVGSSVTSASLMGVTITGSGSGKGVWVKGGSGNVTLEGVNISEVATGVQMEGTGTLMVEGGKIGFKGTYGVMVGSSVKKATLTNVEIKGKGSGSGMGVWVEGKSLTVEGVTRITGVKVGISMKGSGELKVEDGTKIEFEGSGSYDYGIGVYVEGGVKSTTLAGVEIKGNGKGDGIYAKSGDLTVIGGEIKEVERGIAMTGGGTLIMKEGTRIQFKGSDGYGVYVGSSVTSASLTGVTIEGRGGGTGVWVEGGKMVMKQVGISKVETGVVMSGGAMWLKETHLRNVAKGMTIEEAVVVMVEGSVEFKGEYGISLTKGYAFLGGVNIEGKEIGQEGIKVSAGMLDLYKTNVRGVYKGMTVKEGSVVRMLEGEITFKGEHAISLTKGYVDLRKVNMTYKEDNKVKGADVVSPNFIKVDGGKVLAEKVTITGNGGKGQGVKVANGGAVWLKETNFTNVRSGMTVERGGIMRMEGGAITFTGGHGISVSGGQAVLSGFSITGQGDTSKATATGTGVGVSNLGKVMMRGVNISQVGMGAYVTGYGLLVMDKGSITFKGTHGINLISGYALLNGVNIKGPSDKKSTGIELGYGQVLMKGTTFTNVDKAITVTEGDVRMEGGEIEFKGEHGILLGQGGVALMGVTMTYKGNSTTADFIKITGEDTTNAVEAVDPKTRKTFTPKSAVVVAASLKIDGSGHGQALNVTNGGRVVLVNPTYTNVHTGMTITKGAVQMIEGSMEFKGGHGIYLKRGHALLTNVTMTYKGHEKNTTFLKVEATKV
ncbi:hypothetical protein, partial [Bartonella capreoli]|uniref:hypothetical protein n=1 Tax=Bartonella capreoli TaxID=155192 RepID=UPI001ABD0B41